MEQVLHLLDIHVPQVVVGSVILFISHGRPTYLSPLLMKFAFVDASGDCIVEEYMLIHPQSSDTADKATWSLHREKIRIAEKNVFAPANLKAAAGNEAYAELIQEWMAAKFTLRYTGGLVPDIHHILTKVCSNLNEI